MVAVMENAIESYQKYIRTGNPRFQEAERWLFIERNSDAPCSFENICEILQLHPDYLRQGLLRWKKAALETDAGNGHGSQPRKLARRRVRRPSVTLRRIA
jgi:hypothetical protein